MCLKHQPGCIAILLSATEYAISVQSILQTLPGLICHFSCCLDRFFYFIMSFGFTVFFKKRMVKVPTE